MDNKLLQLNHQIDITKMDISLYRALTYIYSSTALIMATNAVLEDNSLFLFILSGMATVEALKRREDELFYYEKLDGLLLEKEKLQNNKVKVLKK